MVVVATYSLAVKMLAYLIRSGYHCCCVGAIVTLRHGMQFIFYVFDLSLELREKKYSLMFFIQLTIMENLAFLPQAFFLLSNLIFRLLILAFLINCDQLSNNYGYFKMVKNFCE